MQDFSPPLDRMRYFQAQVGLDAPSMELIQRHQQPFLDAANQMGLDFYHHFLGLDRTRLVLMQDHPPDRLSRTLATWFKLLFQDPSSERFLRYLWHSGVRHVQVNLDQRFVNLGYAFVRSFCARLIREQVPPDQAPTLTEAINRLLDFCILVATDSFISVTSRCDRQLIDGIAHQVRNPVMVIGGNISRWRRQGGAVAPQALDAVLAENRRLEHMLNDIGVYTKLYAGDPTPAPVDLGPALDQAWEHLADHPARSVVTAQRRLDPAASRVFCDPHDLDLMLTYLLENALDALDPEAPRLEMTSHPAAGDESVVVLEIFNTGHAPDLEQVPQYFGPFASSKPLGTGFGLPIASLAARRNLGLVELLPAPGGAVSLARLPKAL